LFDPLPAGSPFNADGDKLIFRVMEEEEFNE
jgi:hypothetical protein